MATIPQAITAAFTGKMPAAEAARVAAASGGIGRSRVGRPRQGRSWLDGQTQRIVSGPFTLWDCYAEVPLHLSAKRYLLVFCLDGCVKLHFGSFDFMLESGSAGSRRRLPAQGVHGRSGNRPAGIPSAGQPLPYMPLAERRPGFSDDPGNGPTGGLGPPGGLGYPRGRSLRPL